MQPTPTELQRKANSLEIQWSDDVRRAIPLRALRDACPCATCLEARLKGNKADSSKADSSKAGSNPLQVLSLEQTRPLEILSMKPVGNYAYNIEFSDGHNTGIYTFSLLRSLEAEG